MHINYLALVVTTLIAIAFSAVYYILLNKKVIAARTGASKDARVKKPNVNTTMTPNLLIVEFVRTFMTGLVIAYAVLLLDITGVVSALLIGIWLWIGFPAVLLSGSVIHEHFPAKLALIHAGDWLVKILLFSVILTLWR